MIVRHCVPRNFLMRKGQSLISVIVISRYTVTQTAVRVGIPAPSTAYNMSYIKCLTPVNPVSLLYLQHCIRPGRRQPHLLVLYSTHVTSFAQALSVVAARDCDALPRPMGHENRAEASRNGHWDAQS